MTPNADDSARILTEKLQRREPFFYIRYGDGLIECIHGLGSQTCDGEVYSKPLGADLKAAWDAIVGAPNVFIGDWQTASFDATSEHARYRDLYSKMLGSHRALLHFEALLLMRESQALVDFYKAVKADPRKKVLLGPERQAAAAKLLGCQHIMTPMRNLYAQIRSVEQQLAEADFEVLLYGAGMAGNIPVVNTWKRHPERTYIHLGSALDPLCGVKSRRQQLSTAQIVRMFNGI